MADLNKVMLIGRLTRDPQLKFTPSNLAVCEFGMAVGRKYTTASGEQREETAFVDCTLFGKAGETFQKYMAKGKQVYIEGRLKLDQWEDKNGGGKRSKLTVVAENFIFLGAPGGQPQGGGTYPDEGGYAGQSGGGQGGGGYERSAPPSRPRPPQQQNRPAQQPQPEAPYGEEQQFGDDDIPF